MIENGNSEIILAEPRGFCAGVDRAIDIVEHALTKFGAPIYVRHEIVHNTHVVDDLRARGAIFIEDLNDVPPNATLVFSAHGVPKEVEHEAERRGFRVFDATCPLVTKVHVEVAKLHKEGYEFIMIGHKGHPEVEGTMGQLPSGIHLVEDEEDVLTVQPAQTRKLAVVTQTTLSVDDAADIMAAVKKRFPMVREPKQQDICYATQNRQDAIKVLSPQVDIVIVVGSPSSSNSNRLRDVAAKYGTPSYMVDNADELQTEWLVGKRTIGLTAGASAQTSWCNKSLPVCVNSVLFRCARWLASKKPSNSRCPKACATINFLSQTCLTLLISAATSTR